MLDWVGIPNCCGIPDDWLGEGSVAGSLAWFGTFLEVSLCDA